MKAQLEQLLQAAVNTLIEAGDLPEIEPKVAVSHTKDATHGDFACNLAMQLAKPARKAPRDIAQKLIDALPADPNIAKVEIAGPGFINFYLAQDAALQVVKDILQQGADYGKSSLGAGKKVQIEFVSANPTGPLHVGHGRGAAYGATVADVMQAAGFDVFREYYVNDAGRQMNILAASVWLRYLECCGLELTFPSNGYKGTYVKDYAQSLFDAKGDAYSTTLDTLMQDIPADEPAGGDKELHIDALIERAKAILGDERYREVFDIGLHKTLDDIRDDLEGFGVTYQNWYSERSLMENGAVEKALDALDKAGHLYEKGGAIWFKSSAFGDEKDRVVKRDNGQTTYFASDIAYHLEKFERGFEQIIDVWGADHHGYVPRVKAALQAANSKPEALNVLLVQFAILYRGGEKVQMSTRSGSFVTLRELREEVGNDAARFFYVLRKAEQHLDFDLDLAKSQSSDNPVYYIQYAHARIHSVLRQLGEKGFVLPEEPQSVELSCLNNSHEEALLSRLSLYPDVIKNAALSAEPHQIAHYLRDLANDFHTYYNAHQFIVEDAALRNARLTLCLATRQVLHNGLRLLGVSAPEEM